MNTESWKTATMTKRAERDDAEVQKAPKDTARTVSDHDAITLGGNNSVAEMARRAAREQTAVAWQLATDLAKRNEREEAAAAAAAREAQAAIAAESTKQYREIVLCLAEIFIACDVDESVVRHVSRRLDRIHQRRRSRLQIAHDGVRLHEAHEAMACQDTDEINAAHSGGDHGHRGELPRNARPVQVGEPALYPSLADLVTGLAR